MKTALWSVLAYCGNKARQEDVQRAAVVGAIGAMQILQAGPFDR